VRSPAFPPVAELMPHSGPMCLLDAVLEHTPERTVGRVEPSRSARLADRDGGVPIWVGLEYMAQCVAVHGGLAARSRGEPLRPGLLLGSRRLRFGARALPPHELAVEVRHHRGERGLVVFDCQVRDPSDGSRLVEGRLNFYVGERWADFREAAGRGS
jgi:predicted hotdog family 3-hydroxylacyl-ACP dehydratase